MPAPGPPKQAINTAHATVDKELSIKSQYKYVVTIVQKFININLGAGPHSSCAPPFAQMQQATK